MLNNIEFDLWADGYDKTVGISDEENTYPFAGYKKVLGFIFHSIISNSFITCKLDFYAFLIGCLITVFHFSGATFLASDI